MFERYTEKARRVIFFARYEASGFGSPYIETEHLLLGILREDKLLTRRFFRGPHAEELIRKEIEKYKSKSEFVPTNVDLPLSNECKRVLAYSAEEAESLDHKHIGTEHLLLGLLREENSFAAALLRDQGLGLWLIRQELKQPQGSESGPLRSHLLLEAERMVVDAINRRDAARLESFFWDDAKLILGSEISLSDKREICDWIADLVSNKSTTLKYRNLLSEVSQDGSLAYTGSEYNAEIVRQDDSVVRIAGQWVQSGDEAVERGRSLQLWRALQML